jgi:hypothetical protein
MDRRIVALLNTALEEPDPLETPLGAARWWSALQQGQVPVVTPGRPRFDAAFTEALRHLREEVSRLAASGGGPLGVRFRGADADAILFEIAHAVCSAAADGTLKRTRRCVRQACARYFVDETKNGSRRWCSLRCMERARAPRRRTISR